MIIPVRCFTCGKIIADKYNTYTAKVSEYRKEMGMPNEDTILKVSKDTIQKKILHHKQFYQEKQIKQYQRQTFPSRHSLI